MREHYRGVREAKLQTEWHSEIYDPQKGRKLWLGSFTSAEEAARAYDRAAVVILGDDAQLNLPDLLYDPSIFDHSMGLSLKPPDQVQRKRKKTLEVSNSPGVCHSCLCDMKLKRIKYEEELENFVLPMEQWTRFVEERDGGKSSEKNAADANWLKLSIN